MVDGGMSYIDIKHSSRLYSIDRRLVARRFDISREILYCSGIDLKEYKIERRFLESIVHCS